MGILRTETYKMIKHFKKKEHMEEWLTQFGFANYMDGIKDDRAATYRHLIDSFGFTDEKIAELKRLTRRDIGLINERYVTASEIIDGLIDEGFKSLKGDKDEVKNRKE